METTRCPQCREINDEARSTCRRCGSQLPKKNQSVQRFSDDPELKGTKFQRGQIFANRYVIRRIVGRGGMGCIYKVHDNTLKEVCALKTLLPEFVSDQLVVERFFNEARIARSLSHPNIVRVHDIGTSDEMVYISMEYLRGRSLREILEGLTPGQRIAIRTVLRIFDELCQALEYAHRYTVHRDIKPENVMVVEDGKVKLMDFGISKLMTATNMTSASMVMGTPHYISPEQVQQSANVDGRADLYSVGVMLYEMLTGNTPAGVPKPASEITHEVPPALDPIIEKCLDPDPDKRYQTASELREALRKVRDMVEAGNELMEPTSRQRRTTSALPMREIVAVILLGLVLLGAVAGIWKVEQDRRVLAATGLPVDAGSRAGYARQGALETESEFNRLMILLDAVIEKADLRKTSDGGEGLAAEWRDAALESRDLATKLSKDDPGAAIKSAWSALHFYFGSIMEVPGTVFIPPGEVSERVFAAGFFVDCVPVSANAFSEFFRDKDWRWPKGSGTSGPMTAVKYYDAQAYAAWQRPARNIPTMAQWTRAIAYAAENDSLVAFGQPKEDGAAEEYSLGAALEIANRYLEWTSSPSNGSSPPLDFRSRLHVVDARIDGEGNFELTRAAPYAYGGSRNTLSFRCVYELPTTLDGANALLDSKLDEYGLWRS